jgi:hypothetical protein
VDVESKLNNMPNIGELRIEITSCVNIQEVISFVREGNQIQLALLTIGRDITINRLRGGMG